jgi:DNA-binding NtrC family response regulator
MCFSRVATIGLHKLGQPRGVTAIRILLVDNELGIRELGTHVLKQAGFKVDSTGNGTKALKMFRSRNYSLVITDLLHPGLNGAELIGKILRLKPWHPVLLYTASPIPTLAKPSLLSHLLDATKHLTGHKKKSNRKPRTSYAKAERIDELAMQAIAEAHRLVSPRK